MFKNKILYCTMFGGQKIILIFCMYVIFFYHCYLHLIGKHLSEVCKVEYPLFVKYCLWLLAEVAVVSADIPEGSNLFFLLSDRLFIFYSFRSKSFNLTIYNMIDFVV
jgi:hypothetical protein